MTKNQAKELILEGRIDLVEYIYVKSLGYAGMNKNGQMVDRRKYPYAIPVQKNSLSGVPEPKSVKHIKDILLTLNFGTVRHGSRRVIVPVLEPLKIQEGSPTLDNTKVPEIEFEYTQCKINMDYRWLFVRDSREPTLNEWIETLEDFE